MEFYANCMVVTRTFPSFLGDWLNELSKQMFFEKNPAFHLFDLVSSFSSFLRTSNAPDNLICNELENHSIFFLLIENLVDLTLICSLYNLLPFSYET